MFDNRPLVSIGLPTYNGERFIREALDSLLAQTYERIEIIISDNASTDRTAEICREYCERYSHIRYFRNETNIGVARNFNRVFEFSSGHYFMWASDHDLWHPTLIERCVALLEQDANVILAYPYTQLINFDGQPVQVMPDRIDTRGMTTLERYRYIIWHLGICNMVYGLFRRSSLSKTGLFRNTFSPDMILLAELSFYGAFAQLPEVLFYRRENRPSERPQDVDARRFKDLFPSAKQHQTRKTNAQLRLDLRNAHLEMIRQVPLSGMERFLAIAMTWLCFMIRYRAGWLSLRFLEKPLMILLPSSVRYRLSQAVARVFGG